MGSVPGVKATYLLAVAHLEILRFSHKGGVIERKSGDLDHISLLACVFKYLENPSLPSDLHQSFTAIAHCAFDAALTWLVCHFQYCGEPSPLLSSKLGVLVYSSYIVLPVYFGKVFLRLRRVSLDRKAVDVNIEDINLP